MTSAQANQGTASPGSPETPAPSSGTPPLAVAAGLLTVFLWASAFIGIRAAGDDIDPGALTLARLFIGAVLLGAVVLVRRVPMPPRSDMPRLILCGLLWFGVYNVALNAAEQRIDAGTTSMIISLGPVLIAVLAGLLLKEGFPRPLVVGGVVALVGVVLIGFATSSKGLEAGTGSALALLAAAAYAGGVVTEKPLLGNSSALVITWLACVVGAVLCLPFPAPADRQPRARQRRVDRLDAVPRRVPHLGRLHHVGGTRWPAPPRGRWARSPTSPPPIAVTLAWLILDETPPWLAVVGGALSLAGVVYSQRKK
ncbi:DMT family transporter [Streptomyces tricolor]|nr:DMT family transporter [Streptomyces tricolor]